MIGRGLWYELRGNIESQALRDVQRIAIRWSDATGAVWLETCGEFDGYAVTIGSGAPRFVTSTEMRDKLPPDGSYPGVVRGTRIELDVSTAHTLPG